jgi:hypothetical protein
MRPGLEFWRSMLQQKREDRLGARPALYVAILLAVVLAAAIGKRGADGIFACQAGLYAPDRYLAYCDTPGYGDYDHGAVWFGLEPAVQQLAAGADALFLGDSRLQFAFSTQATADWFSSVSARYYLWGFAYRENAVFAEALLDKLRPEARVYVINVDPFFERSETEPARLVLRKSRVEIRYQLKRAWQLVHQRFCGEIPAVCADRYAIFRSRDTGAWKVSGADRFTSGPVSEIEVVNQDAVAGYAASGREFLSRLPAKRECVILTLVPTGAQSSGTKAATAAAIAAALDMNLVAPVLDGLQTFDGIHLDPPSAERWSAAFFQMAAPQILKCLGGSLDARS